MATDEILLMPLRQLIISSLFFPFLLSYAQALNKSPSSGIWLFEGADGSKSFAIVSVTCDGEPGIFHEKPHTAKLPTHLGKTLAASAVGSSLVDRHPENLPRILSLGLTSVRSELAQIPGWKDGGAEIANKDRLNQWFPSASTGAVVKLRDSKEEWLPGYLGLSPRLVSGKEHRIGPGFKMVPTKDIQRELADLAEALNVDAVGFLRFDLAYSGTLSDSSGALLNGGRANVGLEFVLLDRSGRVLLQTNDLEMTLRPRYMGGPVGPVVNGNVVLSDKTIDAYAQALASGARGLKNSILLAQKKNAKKSK